MLKLLARLTFILCFLLGVGTTRAQQPPNIILILTDDQGWNNTQVAMIPGREDTKSDFYQTPNMQRLADAGMTFSQAYAPHPVCGPSRHSIQLGISPAKLKKTTNQGVRFPEAIDSLTIPQVLKAAHPEYVAAHFGKWHMYGHPAERGYDASDGQTNNRTGRQLTTDQTKFWPHEDPKRAVSITDDSVEFIKHQVHAGNPFYLQISHYFIHLSAEAKAETLEKYKQRKPGQVHTAYWYAAMLDDLDQAVGRIIDVVEELEIEETTYIIFTSDNGGTARQFPDFNKPLRAGKGSYYEGGIRVPFFAVGPGIASGTYSSVPVVGYDLLPTFHELIESPKLLPPEIEGGSLKSVLMNKGRGSVERPREGIYFSRQVDGVIIQDNLKLILVHKTGKLELYDLTEDLSEANDLADARPQVRDQLYAQLKDWLDVNDVLGPSPHARRAQRR